MHADNLRNVSALHSGTAVCIMSDCCNDLLLLELKFMLTPFNMQLVLLLNQ
jgi:hypothetical protein